MLVYIYSTRKGYKMNIRLKWFLVKNFWFFLCKTNLTKLAPKVQGKGRDHPEEFYYYFLDTELEFHNRT